MTHQQEQYREFAGQLIALANDLRSGATSSSEAALLVATRLDELAGDHSSETLQALANLADRIRARGTESAEEAEKLAEVLNNIADGEDEDEARQRAIWS
ncbi:hypothetical protein [Mycobacteroides abscessus]|uniref:hypothetical protein n=1 Tax=Mycobacteroides abscessus TaxID=36809 RepID=UPI0019D0721A|nr:hypothetical protein [Mycobacteroides abscessus]MBN7412661.1 hypothetical protein [Mycobacteroides abscessus subsp. abscessus]